MRPLQHLAVESAQSFHLWTLQVFWEIVHTDLGCTRTNHCCLLHTKHTDGGMNT